MNCNNCINPFMKFHQLYVSSCRNLVEYTTEIVNPLTLYHSWFKLIISCNLLEEKFINLLMYIKYLNTHRHNCELGWKLRRWICLLALFEHVNTKTSKISETLKESLEIDELLYSFIETLFNVQIELLMRVNVNLN